MLKIENRRLEDKRGKRGDAKRAQKYPLAENTPAQRPAQNSGNTAYRENGHDNRRGGIKNGYKLRYLVTFQNPVSFLK
jgi:hypothetical protein